MHVLARAVLPTYSSFLQKQLGMEFLVADEIDDFLVDALHNAGLSWAGCSIRDEVSEFIHIADMLLELEA